MDAFLRQLIDGTSLCASCLHMNFKACMQFCMLRFFYFAFYDLASVFRFALLFFSFPAEVLYGSLRRC